MKEATMEAAKRVDDDGGEEEETKEDKASRESLVLPLEIITEILLRIPAKSIGRFRCVSKQFCSLSSDLGFVKSHLERTNHRKIIVSTYNLFSLDVDSIGDGCEGGGTREIVAAVELNYPGKDEMKKVSRHEYRRNWVTIIGSSNGLVCIGIGIESYLRKDCVFLFNPTTGDSKRLPEAPVEEEDGHALDGVYNFQMFGFGFDHLTHDYKVVRLAVTSQSNPHVLDVSVYSLKANSWRRRICSLHYKLSKAFCTRGVLLNGAIHWVLTLVQEDDDDIWNQRLVVAFDLNTEEFREMPLPVEAEHCPHSSRDSVVSSLNGRLCVVNTCSERHDDMWVMNEYGDAKSWTRIRTSLLFYCMKPQCSTNNDQEFLLDVDGDMVLYNLKTDASRRITIRGFKEGVGFEADTYVESLVSPCSYAKESRASLLSLKDQQNIPISALLLSSEDMIRLLRDEGSMRLR